MTKGGPSWHDGSFIDLHCIFGIIGHNGMTRFMIGCDGFVLLVYLHTPALWAWREKQDKNWISKQCFFALEPISTNLSNLCMKNEAPHPLVFYP